MQVAVTKIKKVAEQLGIEPCLEFTPELLVPEQRIRNLCHEDKCGNYGKNYMCPPYSGSLEEIGVRLRNFKRGLLLQYSQPLDLKNDQESLRQSKLDFHNGILRLEEFLKDAGVEDVWGMIGGSCELCQICKAKLNEPCPYPEKARTSLAAIAIDVMALLKKFGLDDKFRPDKITWTGCILF